MLDQIVPMSNEVLDASAFRTPTVLLSGTVDYAMYNSFRDQLVRSFAHPPLALSLSSFPRLAAIQK